MIVFVDNENRIKAVDRTTDETLTPIELDETDEEFPFTGWSNAKICCYRVTATEGIVTMMTPYVASSALDYIDNLGKELEDKALAADILLGNINPEEV